MCDVPADAGLQLGEDAVEGDLRGLVEARAHRGGVAHVHAHLQGSNTIIVIYIITSYSCVRRVPVRGGVR